MIKLDTNVTLQRPNDQPQPGRQIFNTREFNTELRGGRTDFSRMDLSGLRLSDIDLDVSLKGCNFSGANLRQCRITDCELDHADFSGADLTDAELNMCTGTYIKMKEACLENVLFGQCNFSSSDFTGTKLNNAKMSSCIFTSTDFEKAELSSVTFRNCDFVEKTNFRFVRTDKKGEMQDCLFQNMSWQLTSPNLLFWDSHFQDVDFSGCDLGKSKFVGGTFRAPIVLERCTGLNEFVGTTFEGVNFLPLVNMPATWKKARGFEQQRAHYEMYKTPWDDIVKWTHPEGEQPQLSIDLYYYLQHIRKLDALTRKFLREKVRSQMLEGGLGVETVRGRTLFWKIVEIDDALTTSEHMEIMGRPAKSLEETWQGGDSKEVFLVPARADSWSVEAKPSSGSANDAKNSRLFG